MATEGFGRFCPRGFDPGELWPHKAFIPRALVPRGFAFTDHWSLVGMILRGFRPRAFRPSLFRPRGIDARGIHPRGIEPTGIYPME